MELYILRHGIADDGRPGEPDADRALTSEGKKKLRGVLKLARFGGVDPTLVMTSPFRRAVETADVAVEVLGYKGDVLRTEALTPSARPEAVWDELRIHKDESQVLLSGHEPLFSGLTAYLLQSPNLQVDFKKGAMIRIDLEKFSAEPRGVLKWMLVSRLAK
jgi:phosphohistidine phosphatase